MVHLTAAGEKLVLCHKDHVTVYSCDRGQRLSQISYPGVTYFSPLYSVEGQGVLVGVRINSSISTWITKGSRLRVINVRRISRLCVQMVQVAGCLYLLKARRSSSS